MRIKKFISLILSAAIAITSINVTALITASAADPWDGMTEKSILRESGDNLISTSDYRHGENDKGEYVWNGLIQSNEDTRLPMGKYLKAVFTAEEIPQDDTKIFVFQPYNEKWGGWNENPVYFEEAIYDSTDDTYSIYISIDKIKDSLDEGKIKGINISFAQAEPELKLVGYYELSGGATPPTGQEPNILIEITEEDLIDEGLSVSDWSNASKATVYVKMTSGDSTSLINGLIMMGPRGDDGEPVGKASSKYIVGRNNTSDKTGGAIQDNLIGNAGTGNYALPEININKSIQDSAKIDGEKPVWDDSYLEQFTLYIRTTTPNANCELLGIRFNNGKTYPKDFTIPVCEGADYDEEITTDKQKLENSLNYAQTMDSSKYTESTWAAFQNALASARSVFETDGLAQSEYGNAHANLQRVKSKLEFIPSTSAGNPLPFREISGDDTVFEMGAGINLGNTMDGHSGFTPSETAWQNVVTTKENIKALHSAGFNTVRIPVTWGSKIDDENGYKIDENWMSRVQDIVDYCVSLDMYAIINIHHDGAEQDGWLRVASDEIDLVAEKFEAVWRQIAERFKDYDEHLIFESMNEITCSATDKNGAEAIAYDTPIIVNLNQLFVNVVRSTGSNNTKRWLTAVSHYANIGTQSGFTLPSDSYNSNNRIMFAAHIYKHSTYVQWTYNEIYEVVDGLKKMAAKHKVPLFLGEYGNRNYVQAGTETGYNDIARAYFCEIVHKACQVAGVVPVVWDQGYNDDNPMIESTGIFTYWDRQAREPLFKSITDAMMRGTYLPPTSKNLSYDFKDIVEGTTVKPITDIVTSTDELTMTLGENKTITATVSPADTNDVVLWSSDNENVATISRGIIRARGIGTTTIRTYSQSGSVEKEINITVKPAKSSNPAKKIEVESDSYTVLEGRNFMLNAMVSPISSNDYVTYRSSNENVATVSALGKVVAVSTGTTFITMTASSGITKTVKVNITHTDNYDSMDVSLNVLYNDDALKYWGTEKGQPVTVTGNGQYTVKFDLANDLSSVGAKAGVTGINNLTAIYIRDHMVAIGEATSSKLVSADVRYDKVVVDGQELTINNSDFKPALKESSGEFDTGDPINAWDGSVVDEITNVDRRVNFTTSSNPQTMEVTFTLRNVEFMEPTSDKVEEATEMTAVSDEKIEVSNVGDQIELMVKLNPTTTDSFVTFLSSDSSIASVDSIARAADADGIVRATVSTFSEGKVTITAVTENGLQTEFTILVGEYIEEDDGEDGEDGTDEEDNGSDIEDDKTDDEEDDDDNGDGKDDEDGIDKDGEDGKTDDGQDDDKEPSDKDGADTEKTDAEKNPTTGIEESLTLFGVSIIALSALALSIKLRKRKRPAA